MFHPPNEVETVRMVRMRFNRPIENQAQWQNEAGTFWVPAELASKLSHLGMALPVFAAICELWLRQGQPENGIVRTSKSALCAMLGLSRGATNLAKIDHILTLLSGFTIENRRVIVSMKNGKVGEARDVTFGLIEYVSAISIKDGKEIPKNKQKTEIKLNTWTVWSLKNLPPARLPVAALKAVRKTGQKKSRHVLALLGWLSSQTGRKNVRLKLETAISIAGYTDKRTDRAKARVEKDLETLKGTMIERWAAHTTKDGKVVYHIALARI